ncbi:hypothetical protein BO71DRAFT_331285 [Aspergillus ellipticus CBS 707.79]|uniref:Xylanolytic transcriptional activator regulatory domain-containing protein n=1 Tax=Aspergillus ellipticus CBS 707.79 TaxID=1448320 RepID=A0A319D3W7_9EURO|nr:hypothetical protein BO71DRAFT_331285 [Aspergillus ellipticus CBS 707.79]
MNATDCSNSSEPEAFTLLQANREIASLKQEVRRLEEELRNGSNGGKSSSSTSSIELKQSSSVTCGSVGNGLGGGGGGGAKQHYWGGIHFRPARSLNSLWLGPSSLYSFVQRLSVFLSLKFSHEQPAHQLLPISASDNKLLDRPVMDSDKSLAHQLSPSTCDPPPSCVYLTPMQEDFFINHFWQTYHVSLLPILDEAHFKKHYQSLWIAGGKERRSSALVDIVVAMCMQYHISTLPLHSQSVLVDGKDALVAGRWHYWRGQTLLTYELESPSISTLQCHILCAVYLCGGSFHNMMESAVSLAVRTTFTLGLHLEPPSSMPAPEREMRRRLWWAVYLMDSKAGMKLGRPFMLSDWHAMPTLPSDSFEAAAMSGSTFVPVSENTTWLSFNLYQTQLYMTIRDAYNAFFTKDYHLLEGQTIWDNPCAMQIGAVVLTQHAQFIQDWVDSIPDALKLTRQNNGVPFSTDGTPVVIEQFIPNWLQRQRILLELTYHHLCLNLYRPLICFTCAPPPADRAQEMAMRCAAHAVSLTKLSHQVIEETSILDGWHEAFFYQWNAAMTLIGFTMVYPYTYMASDVQDAIGLAISVSENFGAKFPAAANAMKILQGLRVKINEFLAQHTLTAQTGEAWGCPPVVMWDHDSAGMSRENGTSAVQLGDGISGSSELELMELAFDVDFWNNVNVLWPEATGQKDVLAF